MTCNNSVLYFWVLSQFPHMFSNCLLLFWNVIFKSYSIGYICITQSHCLLYHVKDSVSLPHPSFLCTFAFIFHADLCQSLLKVLAECLLASEFPLSLMEAYSWKDSSRAVIMSNPLIFLILSFISAKSCLFHRKMALAKRCFLEIEGLLA